MKRKLVCINLDTLALGTDWRLSSSKDPTYRLADERLISRLEKFNFKLILFVVGKDLESSENRRFVKKWSQAGHNIGNHSYSHPLNLASLARRELEEEIWKTDRSIQKITGKKPISFNAPGWATSQDIDRILFAMNYRHDFSPFLSWWLYPLLFKQWWGLRKDKIAPTVWRRKDIFYPLFQYSSLASEVMSPQKIPMPTVSVLKIPVWHTGWFIFGEKIFMKLLQSAIKNKSQFYYLMHPVDVISREDIPTGFEDKVIFERLNTPVEEKVKYLELALGLLL